MIADVSTFTLKEFGENALSAEVEAEIDVIVPKLVLFCKEGNTERITNFIGRMRAIRGINKSNTLSPLQ